MILQRLLKEGEALVKDYETKINAVDSVLKESAGYRGLDSYRKVNLAIMLDNTAKMFDLRNEMLKESQGTQVGDIARKNDYLNLVSAVMPTLVAEDVVTVQPLKQKAGIAYYMKHVYDSNKGGIKQGDTISSFNQVWPDRDQVSEAINYSSQVVEGEALVFDDTNKITTLAWTPVVPGTVTVGTYTDNGEGLIVDGTTEKGTIDYSTGVVTFNAAVEGELSADYEMDMYNAPVAVPRTKTIITDITLTAKPRKLATGFSLDAAFDLMATQNVDLQSILQTNATDEIRSEIDGEILRDLGNSGTTLTTAWNMTVPFGISQDQHYKSFYTAIVVAANKIFYKTRRVHGNIIIAGENACNVIETLEKFKSSESLSEVGPHIFGTLGDRFIVVKNPYYPEDKFVVAYKGDVPFDGGYVYAPYMPITATQFIMGDNFYGSQGYATSYAKKLVCPEFFVEGTITHIDE